MLTDNELNIIHMNPSVEALLREAEDDLKKELPRFSVATLIGSSIDALHKDPGQQRKILAALEKPHNTTIQVGKRAFDLLVSPLFEHGRRIGLVVEWTDAGQSGEAYKVLSQ